METTQNGELIPLKTEQLTSEERSRVDDLIRQIDIGDSQAIIQYGVAAQKSISTFSDNVLEQIKAKDAGHVGEILTDLMLDVKTLDVDSLSQHTGFFGRLFGSLKQRYQRFIARYETLSVQIERIVNELDGARMQLLKDIALLDGMYDKNLEYLKQLDLFILAGSEKLQQVQQSVLPQMKAEAEQSGDPVLAQKFKDMTQLADRFEKKLYDLKLSRMISIQTAPQLRIIQNNDQLLVEKIQSSILNTIPLWKNQIVIAISLFRQQKALEIQKKVSETTANCWRKTPNCSRKTPSAWQGRAKRGLWRSRRSKRCRAI